MRPLRLSLKGLRSYRAECTVDFSGRSLVAIVGDTGAGKSSLLRACAGLLAVTTGEAEVLGHDLLRDRRSHRRQVGLLGHATSLYDEAMGQELLTNTLDSKEGVASFSDLSVNKTGSYSLTATSTRGSSRRPRTSTPIPAIQRKPKRTRRAHRPAALSATR